MGGKDRVVWLDDCSGDLRCWVNSELEFGFFTVVNGKSLHQQTGETGSGTATERVEDEESLETGALVSEFSGSVENQIDQFFADGVVTSSVVVSGIFFTSDQLFWMEKLSVSTSSDLVDNSWLQINENSPGDVFTGTGFREKGVESIISSSDGFVRWHLTVWLDSVFKTE
jgi:hypothetical protein